MLTKTHVGDGVAGESLDFTMVATNDGPSDAQPTFTIVDTLPAGFTYVSDGPGWTCVPEAPTQTGQEVTCTAASTQPLVPGGSLPPLEMVVQISESVAAGRYTNVADRSASGTKETNDRQQHGQGHRGRRRDRRPGHREVPHGHRGDRRGARLHARRDQPRPVHSRGRHRHRPAAHRTDLRQRHRRRVGLLRDRSGRHLHQGRPPARGRCPRHHPDGRRSANRPTHRSPTWQRSPPRRRIPT